MEFIDDMPPRPKPLKSVVRRQIIWFTFSGEREPRVRCGQVLHIFPECWTCKVDDSGVNAPAAPWESFATERETWLHLWWTRKDQLDRQLAEMREIRGRWEASN